MLFLCYPKCTTCQKARKWLDTKGAAYDYRDINEENPSWRSFAPGGAPAACR